MRGLTFEKAQAHCHDPETSASTCTKPAGKRRTAMHGNVLHKVCVTQVYKTTRKIVMKVEAENIENAVELVASGGIDLPEFNHPDWLNGMAARERRGDR